MNSRCLMGAYPKDRDHGRAASCAAYHSEPAAGRQLLRVRAADVSTAAAHLLIYQELTHVCLLDQVASITPPKGRKRMIGPRFRPWPAPPMFGKTAVVLASTPAKAQNQNMEVIHHPNYDKNVFMPFVPAIK